MQERKKKRKENNNKSKAKQPKIKGKECTPMKQVIPASNIRA